MIYIDSDMIHLPTMKNSIQDRDIHIDSDMIQQPPMKNNIENRDIYIYIFKIVI